MRMKATVVARPKWMSFGKVSGERIMVKVDPSGNSIAVRLRNGKTWKMPYTTFMGVAQCIGVRCRRCRKGKLDCIEKFTAQETLLYCNECWTLHKAIDGKPYLYKDPVLNLVSLFGELGHSV